MKEQTLTIKIMNISLYLLGVSFVTALFSDVVYGFSENAKQYATGTFLSQLSQFSFTLFSLVILIGGVYLFFLKEVMRSFFNYPFYRCCEEYKIKEKKVKKK